MRFLRWLAFLALSIMFSEHSYSKDETRIQLYQYLLAKGDHALLESFLKLRLAVELMSPEERLRTFLLLAYEAAHDQNWLAAHDWIAQAQTYIDYSFQARGLKRNHFFQSEIDLSRWDLKEMEKR